MIDYPEIDWKEQCLFCLKGLNTTYCTVNQDAIEALKKITEKCRGTIEFTCDYFSPDKKRLVEYLTKKEE